MLLLAVFIFFFKAALIYWVWNACYSYLPFTGLTEMTYTGALVINLIILIFKLNISITNKTKDEH